MWKHICDSRNLIKRASCELIGEWSIVNIWLDPWITHIEIFIPFPKQNQAQQAFWAPELFWRNHNFLMQTITIRTRLESHVFINQINGFWLKIRAGISYSKKQMLLSDKRPEPIQLAVVVNKYYYSTHLEASISLPTTNIFGVVLPETKETQILLH